VGELLGRMHLGQYREAFSQQEVAGAVLAQCSAQVLKNELGVASNIHCLRLLQVISGDVSPASL
jgi:hypothetical protein